MGSKSVFFILPKPLSMNCWAPLRPLFWMMRVLSRIGWLFCTAFWFSVTGMGNTPFLFLYHGKKEGVLCVKWRDLFRIFPAAKGKGNRESLNERSERMAYYGKVEISGVNTANLPVLTGTEAKALFIKCREGDEAARQQLIEGNLRLVLSIIKRFENRNENMDDLFHHQILQLYLHLRL